MFYAVKVEELREETPPGIEPVEQWRDFFFLEEKRRKGAGEKKDRGLN